LSKISDYYIENGEGQQRWVSNIFFICPSCDKENRYEMNVPELDFTAEKSGDMSSEGEREVTCIHCESYFYADVWVGPSHCDITLRDHPDAVISCDPPGYDRPPEDWFDDWSTPEEPTQVFDNNYHALRNIIEKQAKSDGGILMNRMIFAQILTFLEAYLCDTLIIGLRKNPERMVNFAENDGACKEAVIPMAVILREPGGAQKWLERNLKDRLYHQFGSGIKDKKSGKEKISGVPLWYRMAFGISLVPEEEYLDKLRKYAALRHDCVHRNGETKEGDKLDLFDKEYLLIALNIAKHIVQHIDAELEIINDEYLPF